MLTKERIESWRAFLSDVEPEDGPELNALCDLALLAVALKPRPLAEIEENTALVTNTSADETDAGHCIIFRYTSGDWRSNSLGRAWPIDTLAIPLSALAGLMEGK